MPHFAARKVAPQKCTELPGLILVVVANRSSTNPDILKSSIRRAASHSAVDTGVNLLRHTANVFLHTGY
eukprot:Skav220039  [mRNA]  locus=scaffold2981:239513:239719:- [translate_table: standard]